MAPILSKDQITGGIDFPIACKSCLGDQPFISMCVWGITCDFCAQIFAMPRWKSSINDFLYKSAVICQACSNSTNTCQACLKEVPARDRPPESDLEIRDSLPKSDENTNFVASLAITDNSLVSENAGFHEGNKEIEKIFLMAPIVLKDQVTGGDSFPLACKSCLGDQPFISMCVWGITCDFCAQFFAMPRWKSSINNFLYKSAVICQACSKATNNCQACLKEVPAQDRSPASELEIGDSILTLLLHWLSLTILLRGRI